MSRRGQLTFVIVGILVITQLIGAIPNAAASPGFDAPINLSNTPLIRSHGPDMAVSAGFTYFAWNDNDQDIHFMRSPDAGATFGSVIVLDADIGNDLKPSVAAATGPNVYVAWHSLEAVGNNEILFARSTNRGVSFASPVNLSNNALSSQEPEIAVAGNNVIVVWKDRTGAGVFPNFALLVRTSTDGGANFGSAINLGVIGSSTINYQVIASGSNVYLAWQNSTGGNTEIYFSRSIDNGITFSDALNVSNMAGASVEPRMATFGTNVYVVWRDSNTGNFDTFFSRSTNSGVSFGAAINLSNTLDVPTEDHQIATSGANVYVTWVENDDANSEVSFRRSTNSGLSFGAVINVSNNIGTADVPQVAASGTNVYVVWSDNTDGDFEIFFRKSINSGVSFNSATINLSDAGESSTNPSMLISNGVIQIGWQDFITGNGDIYFTRSIDNGYVYDSTLDISNDSSNSDEQQIALGGSNLFLVWSDDAGGPSAREIMFRRSIDGGNSFESPINLSNNLGDSSAPQIVAAPAGTAVYVVWSDGSSGDGDIYFRRSLNGGSSFNSIINVSNSPGASSRPQIALSGVNVYVVWEESSDGDQDVYFARSTNRGLSFSAPINLSDNDGQSEFPKIAAIGASVHVTWQDNNDGDYDVLYRRSPDSGANFNDPALDLSNNGGNSLQPLIGAVGSNVYLLWKDDSPSNSDIFFIRSTNGGSSFSAVQNISNNAGDSRQHQMALAGVTGLFIIWTDSSSGHDEVMFRRSANSGSSFFAATILSNGQEDSADIPAISVSGSNVYVAWRSISSGVEDLYFTTSLDRGIWFAGIVTLASNQSNLVALQSTASGTTGNVHVIWNSENGASDLDVFHIAGH